MNWLQIPERIRTVIIYAPIPILMLILSPYTAWVIFLMLALIGIYEWRWIVVQNSKMFYSPQTRIALGLIAIAMTLALFSIWGGILFSGIAAWVVYTREKEQHAMPLAQGQIVISLIGVMAYALRTHEDGLALLGFVLVITIISDSAAYFVGRAIGRTPFAPIISPNKTWEGAIGGWVFAIIAAYIYVAFFIPQIAGWFFLWKLMFFWILSFVSQLGDLAESAFKRSYKVKDSGTIFPGHGGVLDRFDSFGPTALVAAIVLGVFG